jgi:hypothetical protein
MLVLQAIGKFTATEATDAGINISALQDCAVIACMDGTCMPTNSSKSSCCLPFPQDHGTLITQSYGVPTPSLHIMLDGSVNHDAHKPHGT